MRIARYVFLVVMLTFLGLHGTSTAADLVYGKWHIEKVDRGYVFPNRSEIDSLSSRGIVFPEAFPWPCKVGSDNCWAKPGPLPKAPEYQPYALFLREYGYTFIEATKDGNTEHVKWGWKMSVENKSKNDVLARTYCSLHDKNDFLLATYNDEDSVGTFVWKGQKATLQDETVWSFNKNTKPYPPGRVASIKCTLLLKHVE